MTVDVGDGAGVGMCVDVGERGSGSYWYMCVDVRVGDEAVICMCVELWEGDGAAIGMCVWMWGSGDEAAIGMCVWMWGRGDEAAIGICVWMCGWGMKQLLVCMCVDVGEGDG